MATVNVPIELDDATKQEISSIVADTIAASIKPIIKAHTLPPLATGAELKAAFRISDDVLKAWLADGCPYIQQGFRKRFLTDDVIQWLRTNRTTRL